MALSEKPICLYLDPLRIKSKLVAAFSYPLPVSTSGWPNDPSSAAAATRRVDWNRNAMPPFAAAHSSAVSHGPLLAFLIHKSIDLSWCAARSEDVVLILGGDVIRDLVDEPLWLSFEPSPDAARHRL